MLARVSIKAKVTAVVLLLLAIIAGLGGIATLSMGKLQAASHEVSSSWVPRITALGELRSTALAYRSIVRAILLADDTSEQAEAQSRRERYQLAAWNAMSNYAQMVSMDDQREKAGDIKAAMERYAVGVKGVLDHVNNFQWIDARIQNRSVDALGDHLDDLIRKAVEEGNRAAKEAGIQADREYDLGLKLVLMTLAAAVLTGAVTAYVLVRDVARGIGSIIAPMQALGVGNLNASIPHRGLKTEIGQIANALQIFKQALIEKREADELASVDAEEKIRRGERVDSITREFEAVIGNIVHTVSNASNELEVSADTLTSTAVRSQELTRNVAGASEEASSNVQSVATATEELSSSVYEISRQVQQSSTIANEAVDQARRTNERVAQLAAAAARIGDVVELINTIAGQTNLLALNATIEAARAGDAGRGFAVVASEVKALAEQTAKATGEISQQISGIQTATQESVGAIQEIGNTIGRMSEISSTIAAAVEQQGAATQEISSNVHRAAEGTMLVTSNIGDVRQGASATGAASSQVLSAAQSLSAESNRLKSEVGKFLEAVRAA